MTVSLRPEVELDGTDMKILLEKYRLAPVMSAGQLQMVWLALKDSSAPAIWYRLQETRTVIAAVTLGEGPDRLQAAWMADGKLLEAYAADCLAMEALSRLYRVVEEQLRTQGRFISRYQFADDLRGLLGQLESVTIRLTAEGMLNPLKSVVYRGLLTADAGQACSGICQGCGRRDCPYGQPSVGSGGGMTASAAHAGHDFYEREPGVLKYSYGYQRIFGKS